MADFVGHVGKTLKFAGSGTGGDSRTIVKWEWDFGDGTTAEGQTVQHTYSQPGTYTVTLTVTNDCGAKATATHTVEIKPLVAITYDLKTGKNAISVPKEVPPNVFGDDVEVWAWDPNEQKQYRPDSIGENLIPGKGYTLVVPSDRTITIEVEEPPTFTWDDIVQINGIVVGEVGKEWYLVGCGAEPVTPPEGFELYDPVTNEKVTTMQPWKAYWVRVLANVCPMPTVDFMVEEL